MTTPVPRTLCVSSIQLAAVFAAVRQSRGFIRQTLLAWRLDDQIDCAELIVSELVTNAVKGGADPQTAEGRDAAPDLPYRVVGVQLRVVGPVLSIEVWDGGDGSPVIPEQTLDAEGGRGLFLVAAMSERLGVQHPVAGGKIVWAEVGLPGPAEAGPKAGAVDVALMQRALDGFRAAVPQEVAGAGV